jgi:hypothetical protein
MAVLAVAAADGFGRRNDARPDRRRRALRNGLQAEEGLARGGVLVVELVDPLLQSPRLGIGVAAKLRGDAARMDGGRPDAGRPVTSIELDGEQDVGRLRAAVARDGAVAGYEGRKIPAIEETRAA